MTCDECGGQVDAGRCLSCFTEAGYCAECAAPLNSRGRCLDYTCRRFGLLPDAEPRARDEEFETEARAWRDYYEIVHTTGGR